MRELKVTLEPGNTPVPLIEHVNGVLSRVVEDAKELVHRNKKVSSRRRDKMKAVLSRNWQPYRAVLDKETIVSMVKTVEHACQHVHIALALVNISSNIPW
jgi:C4-type Zn-finger protein